MDLISRPGGADPLAAFAAEVGSDGPVVAVGGATSGDLGGAVDPAARRVRAPAGVVAFEPDEMLVRCLAGTTVAELQAAVGERGQRVALPVASDDSTVGGALAAARSDLRRLRLGAARDAVLELRYVSAEGAVVRSGAAVVKNVTGFDLCRLLTGSLGTLGLIGEVVLRTLPLPPASRWLAGPCSDPVGVLTRLHRPSAVLWDGQTCWVLLEGHAADLAAQAAVLAPEFTEAPGPPDLPHGAPRRSVAAGAVAGLVAGGATPGTFVAEVGVGTVHSDDGLPSVARPAPDPALVALHRRLKDAFDPAGRLAPGRDPLER